MTQEASKKELTSTPGERIAARRREIGYTQEQLAEYLSVSRQAVSKWESDRAFPETEKILRLAELFDCSIDELLTGNSQPAFAQTDNRFWPGKRELSFSKTSEKQLFGMPLFQIGKKAHGFFAVGLSAKGVVAIGLSARGVVSLGLCSLGIISFGMLSAGVLSFALLAVGILSGGTVSLGIVASGAIAIGLFSLGAVSVGEFSVGALAIGRYIAVGDHATADIAIGSSRAVGAIYEKIGSLTPDEIRQVETLLSTRVPAYYALFQELIRWFL